MQLHLYLPDDIAEQVKARAEARGLTVSRYLAELVRREVTGGWPKNFFETVVGGWQGELERPEALALEVRDTL